MRYDEFSRRTATAWTIATLLGATACGGAQSPRSTAPAEADGTVLSLPEEPRLEPGACNFPTPDVPLSHAEAPSTEARAVFEAGTAAVHEQDLETARERFAEALRLDPTFSLAAYALGATLVELRRDDEATLAFERVIASDPTSVDALYDLGLLRYDHGELDAALELFQRAHALAPREIDFGKKVVQALLALDRFEEAAVMRREVRRIRACSDDEEVRALRSFVIDQFDVGDEHVLVHEVFEPDPQWTVFYAFQVIRGEQAVRAIQLESDPVSREHDIVALFGIDYPDGRHFTTDHGFSLLPTYEALRPLARELVRESRAR